MEYTFAHIFRYLNVEGDVDCVGDISLPELDNSMTTGGGLNWDSLF